MKDLLIRLCENADCVSDVLHSLDLSMLRRGRVALNERQLAKLLPILFPPELQLSDVRVTPDGVVTAAAVWNSMTFRYRFRIERLRVSGGRVEGSVMYQEERSGSGIGGALLGIAGKSGIAVALAGSKWARVEGNRIVINSAGLPQRMTVAYEGVGNVESLLEALL